MEKPAFLRLGVFFFSLVFSTLVYAAKININTADAETLAAGIDGVGPKLAASIVRYRDQNGPFESIEELQKIKGIGPKLIEKNRAELSVETSSE